MLYKFNSPQFVRLLGLSFLELFVRRLFVDLKLRVFYSYRGSDCHVCCFVEIEKEIG